MIAGWLAGALWSAVPDVEFRETAIDLPAEDYEAEFVDVDDIQGVDLVVTVRRDSGERELRVYLLDANGGYPAEPSYTVAVPADAIAYSVMDVREESGRELLLLARSGVFSLSPTVRGLRGNLRRELECRPVFDLADLQRLPRWRHVGDLDGDDRDELLLPIGDELLIYSVGEEGGLVERGAIACRRAPDRDSRVFVQASDGGVSVRSAAVGTRQWFPQGATSLPRFSEPPWLRHDLALRMPGLVDVDGDGGLESVLPNEHGLAISSWQSTGRRSWFAEHEEVRSKKQSPTFADNDSDDRFVLRDLDGDRQVDAVVFREEGEGLDADRVVLVYPAATTDGAWTPAAEPVSRVKLAGVDVDYELSDVDGDGRIDLIARKLDIPRGVTALAGIRLELSLLVYLGQESGGFAARPALSLERSYKPEEMERVRESLLFSLEGDYSGDGVGDLLIGRPDGWIEIRRAERNGDSLRLLDPPLAEFQPREMVRDVDVWDLSHDGVSDLALRHEKGLTVFVSQGSRR